MSSVPENGRGRKKGVQLRLAKFTGDVSPYVAMCGREVVETSFDLDSLIRHLVSLTHSTSSDDIAIFEDEKLVAAVFSTGQVIVFRHLSVTLVGEPSRDSLHPEGF